MPRRPWAGALQGGGRRFNWWLKVGPFPWDGNPPYLIRLMSEKSTNRTPKKNCYWRFNQKLSLILIGSVLGTLAISKTYSEGADFKSCTNFLCIKSRRSQSKHSPKSKYPQGPNHKSSKSLSNLPRWWSSFFLGVHHCNLISTVAEVSCRGGLALSAHVHASPEYNSGSRRSDLSKWG